MTGGARTHRERFLLAAALVAAALLGVRGVAHAKKPRPEACQDGRFRVAEGGLLAPGGVPAPIQAVVLQGGRVALVDLCPPGSAHEKAGAKATTLKAKWPQCGALKKVRLTGRMAAPACDTLTGMIAGKRQKPVAFRAVRSRCGDGGIDPGNGEECEGATGCAADERCNADRCVCEPVPPPPATTTTTTSPPPSTTTTAPSGPDPTTSTTTTTAPAATSTTLGTPTTSTTTTTVVATAIPVCGDGRKDATERCDVLASPSGCGTGEQCELVSGACGCTPVPAVIGKVVSFTPSPPVDLDAIQAPKLPDGTFPVVALPGTQLSIDQSLKDSLTTAGRCARWIVECLNPPARTLDDCARSAPACATSQPWLESAACCPAACFTAYQTMRQGGSSTLLALRSVYFDDGSCFPGLRAFLGRP